MNRVEAQGKSVDEAIKEGLKMLGTTLDEVDVKIISEGGFFKKAQVVLTRSTPEPEPKASREEAADTVRKSDAGQSISSVEKAKAEQKSATFDRAGRGRDSSGRKSQMEIVSVIEPEDRASGESAYSSIKADMQDESCELGSSKGGSTNKVHKPRTDKADSNDKGQGSKFYKSDSDNEDVEPKVMRVKSVPRFNTTPLEPEQIEKVRAFVESLIGALNVAGAEVKLEDSENAIVFSVTGDKASSIIGHRGECLQALQTIVNAYTRTHDMRGKKVVINTGNYRERREETLRAMANRMAEKAVNTRRSVRMDPMNAYERRIVHDELSKNDKITTESYGSEPRRYITISAK